MPPIDLWGPHTWLFLHSLVEQVNEKDYATIKDSLFMIIKRICSLLPCADCSIHATNFLSRVSRNNINEKQDLIKLMYLFHNSVNNRTRKPLYNYNELSKYKNINVFKAYYNFSLVYHTKGDIKTVSDNFQRQYVLKEVADYLNKNSKCFIKPIPIIPVDSIDPIEQNNT